ncbi:MAG: DUF4271 domain-containing protein [Bacteroidetes bacterium]|uniref:DUF4271 domain-containing protein n=1 Tax=Candidatus Merdivivens pullicola TaxID=2840872 RepID=A0A9D9II78_9BACT|nr:DUF4271 domain-containing protein [Candidatus Merdivivens pullicola]
MAESDTSLYVLPVEEAWGGKLHTVTEIPGNASAEEHIYEAQWRDSAWIQGTIAAIIIILLFSLRKIVTVTPVLLGGFIRLKENFNIENSLHIRTSRNRVALISVASMAIIWARYRLLPYDTPLSQSPAGTLAFTLAAILLWWAYRAAVNAVFIKTTGKERSYKIAGGTSYTYFTIATALTYIAAAALYIIGQRDYAVMQKAILASFLLIYLIYIIREIQIFVQCSRSAYSTFLYLCTLEIIPAVAVLLSIIL